MRRQIISYLCLAWLLGSGSTASAFFRGGLEQTFGTDNYRGTNGYIDIGKSFHVKPAFSTYRSDTSSGTYNTFSARLGYDTTFWGFGLVAGFTPKNNDYRNRFVGADIAFSFTPTDFGPVQRIGGTQGQGAAPRGKGLARVDLGAGVTHTTHSDDLQSTSNFGRGGISRRAKAIDINQTDVYAFGGVSFLKLLLSAQVTQSKYDRDLAAIAARSAQRVELAGVQSLIDGFPDTSAHVRFEMPIFPLIAPFASYTHTTFRLGAPPSNAYAVGVYVGLEVLEVHASYQRYVPGGGAKNRDYASIGVGMRL